MAKVVIIEDEVGIQTLLRRIVGMLGHEVAVAGDGPGGLRLAQEPGVALIISDLSLPGEPNGLDLIRALRAQCPSAVLVVSTGYTTAENMNLIRESGVAHVLGKPFDMAAVRSLVTGLIGNARAS